MIAAQRPLAYMVALDLAGRRGLVVGGGEIAARRVQGLLDAGAQVTVVAAHLDASLAKLADRGDIAWVRREYRRTDLAGTVIAFNTRDDRELEGRIRKDARRAGVLLNTHDRPAVCDFASPALVRRGRLQVAISTSGDSPHVAAAMRERLESLIGPEWGLQLSLIANVRRRLRRAGVPIGEQQDTYRELMRGRVREALRRHPAAGGPSRRRPPIPAESRHRTGSSTWSAPARETRDCSPWRHATFSSKPMWCSTMPWCHPRSWICAARAPSWSMSASVAAASTPRRT